MRSLVLPIRFDGFEAEQAELAISQLRRYEDALERH